MLGGVANGSTEDGLPGLYVSGAVAAEFADAELRLVCEVRATSVSDAASVERRLPVLIGVIELVDGLCGGFVGTNVVCCPAGDLAAAAALAARVNKGASGRDGAMGGTGAADLELAAAAGALGLAVELTSAGAGLAASSCGSATGVVDNFDLSGLLARAEPMGTERLVVAVCSKYELGGLAGWAGGNDVAGIAVAGPD